MKSWFRSPAEDAMKATTLTPDERRRLDRLEAKVEAGVAGVQAMIEAGRALAEIRDFQLFRTQAPTWEAYCDSRFKITMRRVNQMIVFSGVVDAVQAVTGTTVPDLTERAVRPLAGLDAATLAEAVAEAAEDPAGITGATLRKAAGRRKARTAKAPRPWRQRVPGATVVVTLNGKAVKAGVGIEAALVAALEAYRRDRGGQADAA